MILHLMRHGAAEDHSATGRDFDRVLTPEGCVQVRAVAARLRASRSQPLPRVLSSPLARARETAELVASLAGAPGIQLEARDELAADEPPAFELVEELRSAGRDALLVGHQPAIEVLARRLGPAHPGLGSGFRTALIVVLEHAGGGWRAIDVLDPRVGN